MDLIRNDDHEWFDEQLNSKWKKTLFVKTEQLLKKTAFDFYLNAGIPIKNIVDSNQIQ